MQISANTSPEQSPAAAETERSMLMLKKQQDVSTATDQALVSLIDKAAPKNGVGGNISVYA